MNQTVNAFGLQGNGRCELIPLGNHGKIALGMAGVYKLLKFGVVPRDFGLVCDNENRRAILQLNLALWALVNEFCLIGFSMILIFILTNFVTSSPP